MDQLIGRDFTLSTLLIQTSANLLVSEHPSADANCRIMLCCNTLTNADGCMRLAQIRQKVGGSNPFGRAPRKLALTTNAAGPEPISFPPPFRPGRGDPFLSRERASAIGWVCLAGRIALCARDVDVDPLVRRGGDHVTPGPRYTGIGSGGDGYQCSGGERGEEAFRFVPFECAGEVPTGTDGSGLASCGQGVDDAADDLPT